MGLAPNFSITDNMMLKTYAENKVYSVSEDSLKNASKFKKFNVRAWAKVKTLLARPFVDRKGARERAKALIEKLEIVTPSSETPVRRLSSGNVQKVLVGREIESSPNVIVTAYPVRGLDVNSSYLIYDMLNLEKKKGTGILFIGEDLDVMLALCDKIMVICHGKVMGVVHAEKTTKEELGLMMTGALDLSEKKKKEYGKAKDSNLTDEEWKNVKNNQETKGETENG
jgi:simple sugar transport system ATP-binding protein